MSRLNMMQALLLGVAAMAWIAAGQAIAADKTAAPANTGKAKIEKLEPVASTTTKTAPPLTLVVNRSSILRLETPAARIAVGNPAVADITPINPREIYVLAKSVGGTNLIIWSKNGVATMMDVNVIPEPVAAVPTPAPADTEAVEVIKGLDKSQMKF